MNQRIEPMNKNSTLCFLIRESAPESQILLGFKKIGFGAGKYTGFGGKVERGETIATAAIRELEEETRIKVLEENLQPLGCLSFCFPAKPDWSQNVHVFLATTWEGDPAESTEMLPAWFAADEIPFEQMWQDAAHWLPRILAGEWVDARFTFKQDNETIAQTKVQRTCTVPSRRT